MLVIPHFHRLCNYVPVPTATSALDLVGYSGAASFRVVILHLFLLGSYVSGEANFCRTKMSELLFFVLISVMAGAREGVFKMETTDLLLFAERLGVLGAIPKPLVCKISDIGPFVIIHKIGLDPELTYAALHGEQEPGWWCAHLEGQVLRYRWRAEEVIGLAEKAVHEHKWEVNSQFVYHDNCLSGSHGSVQSWRSSEQSWQSLLQQIATP